MSEKSPRPLFQFLMNSDLAVVAPGWWVDHVRVTSNDFAARADLATATPTSSAQAVGVAGTYRFRVAGLYSLDAETDVVGPYTASACVCVPSSARQTLGPDAIFGSRFEAGELPSVTCD